MKSKPYIPKAWYSATQQDGRWYCHRCREIIAQAELDAHTAVCWPEAGHLDYSRYNLDKGGQAHGHGDDKADGHGRAAR